MAADLGGSQISALLESVPGIRNVLRSPVADALVNMIRAAADLRPFAFAEAEELIQYSVRRGLINQSEGEQVLEEVRGASGGSARTSKQPSADTRARKTGGLGKKKAPAKRPAPRKTAPRKPARKPVKKR
jgi:hypothetical protein